MTKAIVLLSGGIDSTVILALALNRGLECHALSFDYDQRHKRELESAKQIAEFYKVPQKIIKVDSTAFRISSLSAKMDLPTHRDLKQIESQGIPNTYVPARNTLFLAFALSHAELIDAREIHFGPNRMDYACYPDCRPTYVKAYQNLINLSTKQAIEGAPPQLITPLIELDKAEIIQEGIALNAPLELTWSCYSPKENEPCHSCDACMIKQDAYQKLFSINYPTLFPNIA
jgi:7-cyano-7-deazaguanine synthase